ncbi:hypothetical protein [Halanaeroarchaeum sulfurireducens]|uniref:Uncharacterized protein n=1 Tax=Halanaeroarchaeum sulfurireducens TaxID=1604004 RepID=A0A0F7PB12_9EURY|nr:hypothetical protein [Halanaeroarchaeum sulfurireducens]AKH96829.1 hypothetical protein HLASF_0322 [Halanaeroarchaeum sulfurireducens]ALG81231.1 hypothetical protein HLASA_0321 [Halanaeroarchaeum sulfurireducens]
MATQGSGPLGQMADGEQLNADEIETDGAVNITVDGTVTPGENVTITALLDGEPVRFAEVSVNGEDAYETDENGSVVATVPDDDEFEVEVEAEREGELEISLEDDEDEEATVDDDDVETEAGDEDESLDLSVDGTVSADENVTITATHAEYPVAGAAVSLNGEYVGETDSNGTIMVTIPDAEEFEVEVEYEVEGELEIPLESDEEDDGDDADDEGQIDLIVEGTLEPGENLSVTALDADGNPISNATVSVNDETLGETGVDGTLTVEIPDDDELEIEVTHEDRDAELTVDFEDAEDEHDSDDEDGDYDDEGDEKADDDDEDDEESDN